jgi:hypothetical protein
MKRVIAGLFIVCCISMTGCSGSTPSLTQTSAQPMFAETISAMGSITSYYLSTDLTENYTVVEKTAAQTTTDRWQWKSQRQIDISNKQMYLSMDIHETPDIQAYIFQEYFIGGWSYYEQSSPLEGGMTNPWTKTKLGEDNVNWTNYTQAASQIELLKTAGNTDLVGTVQITGRDCNVFQFSPSAAASADWVLSQGGFSGPDLGWWRTSLERAKQIYIKAFQNGSIKLWIDKDTSLILRENFSFNFDALPGNISGSDIGLAQGNSANVGFKKIIRDFNGEWDFSNYNQPVQIQLPRAALDTPNSVN